MSGAKWNQWYLSRCSLCLWRQASSILVSWVQAAPVQQHQQQTFEQLFPLPLCSDHRRCTVDACRGSSRDVYECSIFGTGSVRWCWGDGGEEKGSLQANPLWWMTCSPFITIITATLSGCCSSLGSFLCSIRFFFGTFADFKHWPTPRVYTNLCIQLWQCRRDWVRRSSLEIIAFISSTFRTLEETASIFVCLYLHPDLLVAAEAPQAYHNVILPKSEQP